MFRENFPLTKEDHFLIGVFIMLYFSHESRISTWNFIKQNWDKIQSRCAGGHQKARLVKVLNVLIRLKDICLSLKDI